METNLHIATWEDDHGMAVEAPPIYHLFWVPLPSGNQTLALANSAVAQVCMARELTALQLSYDDAMAWEHAHRCNGVHVPSDVNPIDRQPYCRCECLDCCPF